MATSTAISTIHAGIADPSIRSLYSVLSDLFNLYPSDNQYMLPFFYAPIRLPLIIHLLPASQLRFLFFTPSSIRHYFYPPFRSSVIPSFNNLLAFGLYNACVTTPCLRKIYAKLFLSELCQISINFNNL